MKVWELSTNLRAVCARGGPPMFVPVRAVHLVGRPPPSTMWAWHSVERRVESDKTYPAASGTEVRYGERTSKCSLQRLQLQHAPTSSR